ncbi:MAG: YceI family protein [Chloroflexota bacterium]
MKIVLGAVAVILVAVLGVVGYIGYSIFKPPAEASGPITAAALPTATVAAAAPAATTAPTTKPAAAAPAPTTAAKPAASSGYGAPAAAAKPTAAPISAAGSTSAAGATPVTAQSKPAQAQSAASAQPAAAAKPAAAAEAPVFRIDQSASTAKFIIDEVLRGEPKTVIGETDQVAGQFAADLEDIDAARVGAIRINARTLSTDSDSRNRMLQNRILETQQHEFITFTPTRLVGLPDTVEVGQEVKFQMVGTLAIKGTEKEATFDVTMKPTADDRMEGTATTKVRYADWGISIPQVPSVTGVSDDVGLELNFVAKAA